LDRLTPDWHFAHDSAATTSTTYVGGVYEKTNTGAIKKYYAGFGRTVAVRDVPTGSGNGTLSYILPDHFGSAPVITNGASSPRWPTGRAALRAAAASAFSGMRFSPNARLLVTAAAERPRP